MPANTVREEKNRHHPIPDIDDPLDDGEMEESLYLAPDGTMTTYYEGDEEDPNSVWFEHPPTFTSGTSEFGVNDLPLRD